MENFPVQPIFLFSLQRSGSTLCQRILAAHEEISTASETHLLIPYFYSIRNRGVYSEYGHQITSLAIQDFCKELPGGVDGYLAEIRNLALRLYNQAANGRGRYFLDKAAKYHLVVDEIFQTFPDAKFIFLWRNPLSVIASLTNSWDKGNWNIYHYEISLYRGLPNLLDAYLKYQDRACMIQYEQAVQNPIPTWQRVFDYLDLPFDPEILVNFNQVELRGRVGDQWGTREYQSLSTASTEKWRKALANPLRKAWCRRYLRWLGHERLALMGYDLECLLDDLNSIPFSFQYLPKDLVRMPFGVAYRWLELRLLKHKFEDLFESRRIYIHN